MTPLRPYQEQSGSLHLILRVVTGKFNWMTTPKKKWPFQLGVAYGSIRLCCSDFAMPRPTRTPDGAGSSWATHIHSPRLPGRHPCTRMYFSQVLANLRQVLERLRVAKLNLSRKKCTLFQKEVNYLGHVVNEMGISPDPCKVEAVKSWPKPTMATEVKSFLCLCSYYRRFINSFAVITHLLH